MSRELHADARSHFIATMGFQHDLDDVSAWGAVTVGPYLQTAGTSWPLAAALLTFADVLIGRLASQRTAPRISVTADLGVQVLRPVPAGQRIDMRATLLKSGRSTSVGRAELRSPSGELVGTSLGTFLASPRPEDTAPEGFPTTDPSATDPVAVAPTLMEQVGLRVLSPGVAEISLRPDLHNATQSLQGGLVALLGEAAGQSAATAATGVVSVVDSLHVHYLAAARVGPFRATSEVLAIDGTRARVHVDIRDPGRDYRPVAAITIGTRPGAGNVAAGEITEVTGP